MAVLESHGLAVEIKYARYHASWVEYDFRFSFMGRDIFNREIMNTRQSYSQTRSCLKALLTHSGKP
jgi:hypothetical protein